MKRGRRRGDSLESDLMATNPPDSLAESEGGVLLPSLQVAVVGETLLGEALWTVLGLMTEMTL